MTKRTKKVGVTGKYGTRYVTNLLERVGFPLRAAQSRNLEIQPSPRRQFSISPLRAMDWTGKGTGIVAER